MKPNIEMYLKASEFYGLTEISGKEHNQTILDWFSDIGFEWIEDDETAWCSCFVNWVALKCGCERSFKLTARSWLDVGEEIWQPELGDIVVLWRVAPTSWQGHVGLYAGRDTNGNIYMLGGNQNNQVNISLKNKNRLLSYRRLKNV